jgi:hypothetical protein
MGARAARAARSTTGRRSTQREQRPRRARRQPAGRESLTMRVCRLRRRRRASRPGSPAARARPSTRRSSSRAAGPPSSSISVHENRLGHRPSIHRPSATPSSVGMTTDQPTSPYMPEAEPRAASRWRRARSLRRSWPATGRRARRGRGVLSHARSPSSRKAADEVGLEPAITPRAARAPSSTAFGTPVDGLPQRGRGRRRRRRGASR